MTHPSHYIEIFLVIMAIVGIWFSFSNFNSVKRLLIGLYVGFDDESMKKMEAKWEEWGNPCRLLTLKSKYRSVLEPLSRLIRLIEEKEQFKAQIQVVFPQFVTNKWWHNLLHNQTALLLRLWLLRHKDVSLQLYLII